MSLDDAALRHLIDLLDDEDPRSLGLVRARILEQGERALPFLDELRRASPAVPLAQRAAELAEELRFRALEADFARLAASPAPDLEEGAFLVSRFGHPGADLGAYRAWLDRVAKAVSEDLPDDDVEGGARRLSEHLYKSLGFAGNEADYYDPDNSYLTRVIDTRRGIPVTLTILYLLLAKRLKLPLYGVGTPGHFLAGFRSAGEPLFVDCFRKGRLMTLAEVRRMLVRNGYDYRPEYVRACPPRDILARMMRNLISIYQKSGATARAERLSSLVETLLTGRRAEDA
ncbi:MAG: transglutaminase-like domain-containing protein [Elusimicrobiota bacterium]|nr:transglutaminase-like domain-containing protein [Elusimicrobiota bacterium]